MRATRCLAPRVRLRRSVRANSADSPRAKLRQRLDTGASILACDAANVGAQSWEEPLMIDLAIKVAVNAVALLAAANFVPEFKLIYRNNPEDWLKIALIALVFALVNSYIKPIVKALAMPIGVLTMGLVAFIINAAMLLGTALIVSQAGGTLNNGLTLGGYPPHWSYEAIGCAVVASIVISIVSTALSFILAPRRIVGL
jgi:putative membrane protein